MEDFVIPVSLFIGIGGVKTHVLFFGLWVLTFTTKP
jgi:hypothetical protein